MKLYHYSFALDTSGYVTSFNRTQVVQEVTLYKPSIKVNDNGSKNVTVFVDEDGWTRGSCPENFCSSLNSYVDLLCRLA